MRNIIALAVDVAVELPTMISVTCECCNKNDECFCTTIGSLALTDIRESDCDSYLKIFSTPDIYRTTLRIPYPYTIDDAQAWITHCKEAYIAKQLHWNFAIRVKSTDEVIGGIGATPVNPGVAEVGYWLSPAF